MSNPVGRPSIYTDELLEKARGFLDLCKDSYEIKERPAFKWKGDEQIEIVERYIVNNSKIPTKGGLARYLNVSRETLYDWAEKYQEFSDIMEQLGADQEERLINNGLNGTYNPTIAKVLLTKHGYREGQDVTSNDKNISIQFSPLFNAEPPQ